MGNATVDHRRLHDEENTDFSAYLHSLDEDDWERPSLCEGWRVRDVVGHILYGNEQNLLTLPFRLAKHGFSSDRSGKAYSIARAERRSRAELVAAFDARDPWAGTCRISRAWPSARRMSWWWTSLSSRTSRGGKTRHVPAHASRCSKSRTSCAGGRPSARRIEYTRPDRSDENP